MADIVIEGLDALIKKLGMAAAIDVLEPPMQRTVLRVQRDMADYPRQRPSAYVRTGTLGRRWTTKVTRQADGIEGKVGNNTEYGPWVQSSMFQARIHRGHWQTDQEVLDRNEDAIQRDFDNAVQRELDK